MRVYRCEYECNIVPVAKFGLKTVLYAVYRSGLSIIIRRCTIDLQIFNENDHLIIIIIKPTTLVFFFFFYKLPQSY